MLAFLSAYGDMKMKKIKKVSFDYPDTTGFVLDEAGNVVGGAYFDGDAVKVYGRGRGIYAATYNGRVIKVGGGQVPPHIRKAARRYIAFRKRVLAAHAIIRSGDLERALALCRGVKDPRLKGEIRAMIVYGAAIDQVYTIEERKLLLAALGQEG